MPLGRMRGRELRREKEEEEEEKALLAKGPSTIDVTQIFHIFVPPPPLSMSNSRNLSELLSHPLPFSVDIIYGRPLKRPSRTSGPV